MEGVGGAPAVAGGVGEGADELELFDDRPGPAVGDDERQGVGVGGAEVEEVELQAVDLGQVLGQGVQFGLDPPQVVVGGPVAGEGLHGRQPHALGVIVDRLGFGPAGGLDAPAQLGQVLIREPHPKRTNRRSSR